MKKNKKPLIGINTIVVTKNEWDELGLNKDSRAYSITIFFVTRAYVEFVRDNGGIPIVIPPLQKRADIKRLVGTVDGLVMIGSVGDVVPSRYGQKTKKETKPVPAIRDRHDFHLFEEAHKQGKPVFGICGGMQEMNVFCGGTLNQDIPNHRDVFHKVGRIKVKSIHHQSVAKVGKGLKVVGTAPDGTIEHIESEDGSFIGVQWHPEMNYKEEAGQGKLFARFIEECKKRMGK